MIVCSCNVFRCADVRRVALDDRGAIIKVSAVYERLGCAAQCGRCARTVRDILVETRVACKTQCGPCAQADSACAVAVSLAVLDDVAPAADAHGRAALLPTPLT